MPPQPTKGKEKAYHSANTINESVTSNTQVTIPIVVYQMKDVVTQDVSTFMLNISAKQAMLNIEKDGIEEWIRGVIICV